MGLGIKLSDGTVDKAVENPVFGLFDNFGKVIPKTRKLSPAVINRVIGTLFFLFLRG
jgi:hypothetical protein